MKWGHYFTSEPPNPKCMCCTADISVLLNPLTLSQAVCESSMWVFAYSIYYQATVCTAVVEPDLTIIVWGESVGIKIPVVTGGIYGVLLEYILYLWILTHYKPEVLGQSRTIYIRHTTKNVLIYNPIYIKFSWNTNYQFRLTNCCKKNANWQI